MPADVSLVHDPEPEQQLPVWKRDLLRRLEGLQRDSARLFDEAMAVGSGQLAATAMQRSEKQLWLELQIRKEPTPAAVNAFVVTVDGSARETIMQRLDAITRRRTIPDVNACEQSAPHPEQ